MRPGGGLTGRKVIVTRPEPDDGSLATALTIAGATPVHLPLLRIERLAIDPAAIADIAQYDWIVFTSANGVKSFGSQLDESGLAGFVNHPGIATVGPATAKAVHQFGARPALVASKHVAEALVAEMGDVDGQRILWPRAASARPIVARGLETGGAIVTQVVVYRNVPVIPPDADGTLRYSDAVTFMSPSAVRSWSTALGKPRMPVVCIGPVTAGAAHIAGFQVDAVADPYTVCGIVEALCRLFDQRLGRLA